MSCCWISATPKEMHTEMCTVKIGCQPTNGRQHLSGVTISPDSIVSENEAHVRNGQGSLFKRRITLVNIFLRSTFHRGCAPKVGGVMGTSGWSHTHNHSCFSGWTGRYLQPESFPTLSMVPSIHKLGVRAQGSKAHQYV